MTIPVTEAHRQLVQRILSIELDPSGPSFFDQTGAIVAEFESKVVEAALREPGGWYRLLAEACDAVGEENKMLRQRLLTDEDAATIRRLAAASISPEFAADALEVLDRKCPSVPELVGKIEDRWFSPECTEVSR